MLPYRDVNRNRLRKIPWELPRKPKAPALATYHGLICRYLFTHLPV